MADLKGTCRVCGRQFTLTKRGGVRVHGSGERGMNCRGSGQEPREHLRMGRDYMPGDVYRALGLPVPPVWQEFERERGVSRG